MGNENQQVVQQQYQQQVMVPVSQSVQGPMPVYYSVITPTQQNSTRYVQINTYSYKWNSSSIEEMSSELKNVFTLNLNFWQSDNHNSQL